MKKENVTCASCGETFEKVSKEIKRSIKLGRKQYCSISCAKKCIQNLEHLSSVRSNDASHLNPANRLDEYSIFKPLLGRLQYRKQESNITLQDLKEIWENCNGICRYSGVQLIPVKHKEYNDPIYTMSLDRIDSTKGYIKGNIQFISIAMNLMKSSMTEEQMQELLEILKKDKIEYHNNSRDYQLRLPFCE